MIKVYVKKDADKSKFLEEILYGHLGRTALIRRTENGKPYIEGNPLYFNTTDSGGYCAIAISPSPVGVDMEVFGKGIRKAVMTSYTEKEQSEIQSEEDFLTHWTARESYIKLQGDTLAHMLHLLTFTGGKLYYNNEPVTPNPRSFSCNSYVISVCGEEEADIIAY